MSFGLRKSFGRIVKEKENKINYENRNFDTIETESGFVVVKNKMSYDFYFAVPCRPEKTIIIEGSY